MTSQAHPSKDRLMAGGVCVAAITVHYVRVLAAGSFWVFRDVRLDFVAGLFILLLCIATFTCVLPAVLRPQTTTRVLAGILLLVVPSWIIGHFAFWLLRVYAP